MIAFRLTDSSFLIAVTDRGPKIHDEEHTIIFQPFYRIENRQNVKGFYLAYRIIKLHKGDITLNTKQQKATCFPSPYLLHGAQDSNPVLMRY